MHAADSSVHRSTKKTNHTAILKRQLKFFESIKEQLLADPKYQEKFVAIKDESIIGVGDDELDLVEQMQLANPGHVILVKKVTKQSTAVDLPSIEVIG